MPLHADITRPETLEKLPRDFDWVVNCTASGGGGADDYRQIYLEGNRNLVSWLADSPLKKFVYTSSTSVYGQNDGSVVTEKSPAEPEADTAKVLVETEKFLLAGGGRTHNFPAVILRVAGIYGPGRGHWFKQFLRGEARIEGDGARWLNMIHRDDLIGVIIAALRDAAARRNLQRGGQRAGEPVEIFRVAGGGTEAANAADSCGGCGNLAQARRDEQAGEQREAARGVEIRISVPRFPRGLRGGNRAAERRTAGWNF